MQRQKLRSNPRKKFGHRNGRSSCAHSIGKFFLCYRVLFSFETSATGSPGNYLYILYLHIILHVIYHMIMIVSCNKLFPHFGLARLPKILDKVNIDGTQRAPNTGSLMVCRLHDSLLVFCGKQSWFEILIWYSVRKCSEKHILICIIIVFYLHVFAHVKKTQPCSST